MNTCKNCNRKIVEDHTVYTDYFQEKKEDGIYTLCEDCYVKEAKQYIEDVQPKCECGAPLVLHFEDNIEELKFMGVAEHIINLTCSTVRDAIINDEFSEDELEELEEEHIINSMLYTHDVPDEAMIIGGPDPE